LAGVGAAFRHHINGVFAAEMKLVPAALERDLPEMRADTLFAGYFGLNEPSTARS
jgi:hypothetical protein